MAVKAALHNTQVPRVTAALVDGGNVDLTLSDDPYDCDRLNIDTVPLLVTICKIGEHCVVDLSAEEEVCSSASLVVGVTNSCSGDDDNRPARITNIRTSGSGSLHIETITRCMELGVSAAHYLNRELLRVLALEDSSSKKQVFGFLK